MESSIEICVQAIMSDMNSVKGTCVFFFKLLQPISVVNNLKLYYGLFQLNLPAYKTGGNVYSKTTRFCTNRVKWNVLLRAWQESVNTAKLYLQFNRNAFCSCL
jgi:hypothetical protein